MAVGDFLRAARRAAGRVQRDRRYFSSSMTRLGEPFAAWILGERMTWRRRPFPVAGRWKLTLVAGDRGPRRMINDGFGPLAGATDWRRTFRGLRVLANEVPFRLVSRGNRARFTDPSGEQTRWFDRNRQVPVDRACVLRWRNCWVVPKVQYSSLLSVVDWMDACILCAGGTEQTFLMCKAMCSEKFRECFENIKGGWWR